MLGMINSCSWEALLKLTGQDLSMSCYCFYLDHFFLEIIIINWARVTHLITWTDPIILEAGNELEPWLAVHNPQLLTNLSASRCQNIKNKTKNILIIET